MSRLIQSFVTKVAGRGRGFVCLLVAITFLYNPLLATASPMGRQSVSHLPSFRATVASSELLKFTPEDKKEHAPAVDLDVAKQIDFVVPASCVVPSVPEVSKFVSSRFLPTGHLFFRPPPAA